MSNKTEQEPTKNQPEEIEEVKENPQSQAEKPNEHSAKDSNETTASEEPKESTNQNQDTPVQENNVSEKDSQPSDTTTLNQGIPDNLPEKVRILKEAFPGTDIEIVQVILQAKDDNLEDAFETLLGISDPNYNNPDTPPPMPPRPNQRKISVEEQVRLDEEFAKKLVLEEKKKRSSSQQSREQQQRNSDNNDDDIFFNLQEELPIIKEKMKEAGNAAKNKIMDFYNQIKANAQKNNANQFEPSNTSSTFIPATNAKYRGFSGDNGEELLVNEKSALHLSDHDVHTKTGLTAQKSSEYIRDNDTIYVNPPLGSTASKLQTSTPEAQLKADEDFARMLAQQDETERRRSRHSSNDNNIPNVPPQMPPRKNLKPPVVISTRSPLDFDGDSDYEDVGLTAATSDKDANTKISSTNVNNVNKSEPTSYIIGDDDDDDLDSNLKDLDEVLKDFNEEDLIDDVDLKDDEEIKTDKDNGKSTSKAQENNH